LDPNDPRRASGSPPHGEVAAGIGDVACCSQSCTQDSQVFREQLQPRPPETPAISAQILNRTYVTLGRL